MRILIITGIFPPDIGGPATQLDALSKELIKNDFSIRILTFGRKDEIKYSYPVIRVSKNWPYPLKNFIFLIKGLLLALKSDVIYNQDLYTAGLTSLIIKKILRKPLITRFVGDSAWEKATNAGLISDDIMTFQEKKYNWLIEWRKKIRKKILTNSDKIIVVSYFLKDLIQKIGLAEDKIKVIYNSVDFLKEKSVLLNKEELKQKFSLEGKVILTNARLTPWKGVDMLIEIFPRIINTYNQINLVIVGQGPELNNLKNLTKKLNLENNVIFVGKADRQTVINYLRIADLFVLNTNYEGMSHTLLEAMKIGVPIITTSVGGNPETIKDGQTGLLVDYRDKEQWLKAINSILDNPGLAEKLVRQAKEDLERFNWNNLVQKTTKILRSFSNYSEH